MIFLGLFSFLTEAVIGKMVLTLFSYKVGGKLNFSLDNCDVINIGHDALS